MRFTEGAKDPVTTCPNFERKFMPNIKITAEVDGRQVPLENISTETFEAIKALEKPFVCPKGWVIEFEDWDGDCGWRIMKDKVEYLHKDFAVKVGTGWDGHEYGEAPGYWPTKKAAEDALKQYLKKSKKTSTSAMRLATFPNGERRLIFKVTEEMAEHKNQYVAINPDDGRVYGHWPGENDKNCGEGYGYSYENIRTL